LSFHRIFDNIERVLWVSYLLQTKSRMNQINI